MLSHLPARVSFQAPARSPFGANAKVSRASVCFASLVVARGGRSFGFPRKGSTQRIAQAWPCTDESPQAGFPSAGATSSSFLPSDPRVTRGTHPAPPFLKHVLQCECVCVGSCLQSIWESVSHSEKPTCALPVFDAAASFGCWKHHPLVHLSPATV